LWNLVPPPLLWESLLTGILNMCEWLQTLLRLCSLLFMCLCRPGEITTKYFLLEESLWNHITIMTPQLVDLIIKVLWQGKDCFWTHDWIILVLC
jgi:hypothetical protein